VGFGALSGCYMAKFYFAFHDSKQPVHHDEEGLEFSDANQARADAARSLANYLADYVTFDDQVVKVVVRGRVGQLRRSV